MTKQNLLDLADRVEAGENQHDINLELAKRFGGVPSNAWVHSYSIKGVWSSTSWANGKDWGTCPSYINKLDACQTLMNELLPGWGVEIKVFCGDDNFTTVEVYQAFPKPKSLNGEAYTPAAAWVAAILRAKAGEAE